MKPAWIPASIRGISMQRLVVHIRLWWSVGVLLITLVVIAQYFRYQVTTTVLPHEAYPRVYVVRLDRLTGRVSISSAYSLRYEGVVERWREIEWPAPPEPNPFEDLIPKRTINENILLIPTNHP
jgi:hypothetical protein